MSLRRRLINLMSPSWIKHLKALNNKNMKYSIQPSFAKALKYLGKLQIDKKENNKI